MANIGETVFGGVIGTYSHDIFGSTVAVVELQDQRQSSTFEATTTEVPCLSKEALPNTPVLPNVAILSLWIDATGRFYSDARVISCSTLKKAIF
jgi:hypothetical protein